jgi:FixJ family two-component response regulator
MTDGAKVWVIEDDAAICNSLRILIEAAGMQVETFSAAHEYLSIHDRCDAGCLVVDVRMPGMSGLELQEELARRGQSRPIIFITAYADVPMAVRAMKAGAVDFIEKPFRDQVLLDAIGRAIRLDMDMREKASRQREFRRLEGRLTARERQVMALMLEGMTHKQIAARLDIQPKTADFHGINILRKMRADSAVNLVRLAAEAGGTR